MKILFLSLLCCVFGSSVGWSQTTPSYITGFGSGRVAPEIDAERILLSEIKPDTLRTIVQQLSREVHVAGTINQEHTRDYVLERMKRAGIPTKVYPYEVYLPHAKSVTLERMVPRHTKYKLEETVFAGEKKQQSYPWVNGFSASGAASAPVVYVNYGLHEDYQALDSLGISVKGKIAIARYGKSYRGIKAELAEDHGAVGLLIFSDPSNDGYDAGDPFPTGPMRPSDGVQRGSIYNGHGDPTTPGYASVPGVHHLPLDSAERVPHIPVMPISSAIAEDLLKDVGGPDVPNQQWQGGFAFRYHIGGSGISVKLAIETDHTLKRIWNTVSTITGSTWPDEWVIIGGHRDAWCDGAEDNVAGCASVVAAGEAFAKLAAQGYRPKRSVLFVTWDAEEWGLIGSTEWVEQMERELRIHAVAYINQDMCATGSTFSASADPTLSTLIYESTKAINDPAGGSLYDAWLKHEKPLTAGAAGIAPDIGLLGGGSDFSPFYNHIGIPATEHGFGGPFGQYHSDHDNFYWTTHFGDSTFRYHAASSQLAALEALRLANAQILPFDFDELGRFVAVTIYPVRLHAIRLFHDNPDFDLASFDLLDTAISRFRSAAHTFTLLRDGKILSDRSTVISDDSALRSINEELRQIVFAFSDQKGLASDSYEENMLVISDPANGYADLRVPAIALALRAKDPKQVRHEVQNLADHLKRATELLKNLTSRLQHL